MIARGRRLDLAAAAPSLGPDALVAPGTEGAVAPRIRHVILGRTRLEVAEIGFGSSRSHELGARG